MSAAAATKLEPIPPASASAPGAGKKPFQPWLSAWSDPVSALHAFSPCVRLADIAGDGEYRLLVADYEKKLKVYRGNSLQSEHGLPEMPSALECYYSDASGSRPQLPNIAVAAGPAVYIYRNMRPFYKFTLPPVPLEQQEAAVWEAVKAGGIDGASAVTALQEAKESGVNLSPRSLHALHLPPEQQQPFITAQASVAYQQTTVVTCMSSIYKSQSNDGSVSQLIIGTEAGSLLCLDVHSAAVQREWTLAGQTPHCLAVDGQLDIEYRLFVGCRDSSVLSIKKGKLLGVSIRLESLIVSMVVIDKVLYVACMDGCVHCWSFKGRKLFTIAIGGVIAALDVLHLKKVNSIKLLLVGCQSGQVSVYHKKTLLTTLQHDSLSALRFGQYGREDASLILVNRQGGLSIKILQRNAHFDTSDTQTLPPPDEQNIPLSIPKKSALYLEQTQRERDNAVDIHRIFQRDLCKIRLKTVRAYVKVIQEGSGPLSNVAGITVKLDAKIHGLGPVFKLRLSIRNIGSKTLHDLPVLVQADSSKYRLSCCGVRIPMLVPQVDMVYWVDVLSVDTSGASDAVRVFVMNPKSAIPAIAAVVNMPVSELEWE